MNPTIGKSNEPTDVLFRLKRGLAGYVSYLAACEMNQAFSEYVLYEPILRILTARGYSVECEVECPGIDQPARGDKKRLDFYAKGHGSDLAVEVKWAKSGNLELTRDIEKLRAAKSAVPNLTALICIFGRKSFLESIQLAPHGFTERGKPVYADLRKTKFGCRIFQLRL